MTAPVDEVVELVSTLIRFDTTNTGDPATTKGEAECARWVAERLRDPQRAGGRHVLLPVEFVRQHHVTCVPATLSAISRYWSRPADHLQVADEICYNGTHCYSERKWARENGWAVREFSVTESSAAAPRSLT